MQLGILSTAGPGCWSKCGWSRKASARSHYGKKGRSGRNRCRLRCRFGRLASRLIKRRSRSSESQKNCPQLRLNPPDTLLNRSHGLCLLSHKYVQCFSHPTNVSSQIIKLRPTSLRSLTLLHNLYYDGKFSLILSQLLIASRNILSQVTKHGDDPSNFSI